MTDDTRRVFGFWGVVSIVYALVVGLAAGFLLPWKTPAVNVAFLAYAVLNAAAGAGLARRRRIGHRLGVIAGGLGILACAMVVAGLLASFFYLKGVFGDFGLGASIGALLFASVALQVLGLYPALLLRALLARRVREDLGLGGGLLKLILGAVILIPLAGAAAGAAPGGGELDPVPIDARERASEHLRAAATGREGGSLDALEGIPAGDGPLHVTVWHEGRRAARVRGDGDDLAGAVEDAGRELANSDMTGDERANGVIKVDRAVSSASIPSDSDPILALSVNPGKDGLRQVGPSGSEVILPDDMMRSNIFGEAPLVPGIREMRIGASPRWIRKRLDGPGDLERFRVESWIESGGEVRGVVRGNVEPSVRGAAAWREAAVRGGDFILRQIRDDGRFNYIYRPMSGKRSRGGAYSLPRHSGTIYSLALLFGHTGEERFKRGAERAIAWLETRIPESCGGERTTCIAKDGKAWLGSTALTVVGMLEYQRRTGDDRYADKARGMSEFILSMQRDDGNFDHLFLVEEGRADPEPQKMFYSEEAALALVMAHEVLGDDRYIDAARRALDFLTGPKYDYFLGWFVYGADHWTCIAAHEAWPRLRSLAYLEFCTGYSRFMERLQYEPEGWDNDDFAGHYGFGALMVPQVSHPT